MTIGSLYNAANVVVGQAAVLFAAAGTAMPALSTLNFTDPFDLAPWQTGTAPFAWNPCGATDQGWQFGMNKSTTDTTIEEQSPPVGTQITSQKVTINGSLSEEVSATLALAYNGTLTTTAATTLSPGYDEVNPSDNVIQYAVAMLSQRFDGKPRVYYAPNWTQLSNASTDFRRAAGKRMYPVSFSTVCKSSQIRLITLTAPHT